MATTTADGKPFRLTDYKMQSLLASLTELQKDIVRKLTTPILKYFMQLYGEARDEVLKGDTDWEGDFADLRWYQEKLRGIPKWNVDQIKDETNKIISDLGNWPASDVMTTIMYLRAMIVASIRPAEMKEEVYIPIPSFQTYLHTVMRIVAKYLFSNPGIVRKFPDDDEETLSRNHEKLEQTIERAITGAIVDLTPTAEIVQKYGLLRTVKQAARVTDTESRDMDESEKYGFEQSTTLDEDYDDDDESATDDDFESDYSDVLEDDDNDSLTEESDNDTEQKTEQKQPVKQKHRQPQPQGRRHHHDIPTPKRRHHHKTVGDEEPVPDADNKIRVDISRGGK